MNNSPSPIPNPRHTAEAQRRKYVEAFNDTMVKIWREQIALLGVIDTGALYRSVTGISLKADGTFTSISLSQAFNLYGLYQDRGTGSNTFRENPGDMGRDNFRRRRPWFSRKHYASVMNLQEFYADNLGRDMCLTLASVFDPSR